MCAETASHESGSRSDRKSHAHDIARWGMSGCCCGGSLDDESTIRVAWVHSRGGYLPICLCLLFVRVLSRGFVANCVPEGMFWKKWAPFPSLFCS